MVVVWAFGAVIIHRLGRFHITLTYVASFLALSLVRAAVTGHPWLAEAAPLTGPMYQLYIFFMITDPKTTVRPRWGQCLVAFLVALVEAAFRLMELVHAPYYALFLVGPAANLVEIVLARRRRAAPLAAA
jgi:Na+-translocating ferredoxin:NAD+ oxidoreductase RnfD subunit